jgi:hypothetical protein
MKLKVLYLRIEGADYELVFNEGHTAAGEVRKDALANVSNQHHMQFYEKVKSMLKADALTTTMLDTTSQLAAKEFTKKKIKSIMELKKYTGSASKKTKKESDKFKGWSEEAKAFMVKMTKAINDDVELGELMESRRKCTRRYVMPSIS